MTESLINQRFFATLKFVFCTTVNLGVVEFVHSKNGGRSGDADFNTDLVKYVTIDCLFLRSVLVCQQAQKSNTPDDAFFNI